MLGFVMEGHLCMNEVQNVAIVRHVRTDRHNIINVDRMSMVHVYTFDTRMGGGEGGIPTFILGMNHIST